MAHPAVVGGYELIERVGVGGMASLYLGRRAGARGFVRPVAVKLVHPHLAEDPEFAGMFVDEAHILSRLDHPNIVHVEELGEQNGNLFIVMEFIEGCSVRQLVRHGHRLRRFIPVPLAVHVIASVAEGLHFAHEARGDDDEPLHIVHRDVSPTNVLLSQNGHVKIIDFGIAKSAERKHETTTLKLKGKIAYMSPEQIAAKPLDRRSDVYSLGVVLWEMLAMRRPFRGKDEVELLREVSSRALVPIEAVRDDLPEGLVLALRSATERDPNRRLASARAFRDALLEAVPAAREVGGDGVAQRVREVVEARGTTVSSRQRVREGRDISESGFTPSIPTTPAPVVEVSDPITSVSPFPTRRRTALVAAVVAALGTLALGVFAAYRLGPEPTESVALPSEPSPTGEPVLLVPPGADKAEKTEESPARAEKPPAGSEKPRAEPDERSPKEGAVAGTTSDAPARRAVRRPARPVAKRRPKPVEAEPSPPPSRGIEVDGIRLAGPEDLDRGAARGRGRFGEATAVEHDGAILAEEYP